MRRVVAIVFVAQLMCAPALAQSEPARDVDAEILRQLVEANHSLEVLVSLVKKLADQQEADVLVRRIEIEERAILTLNPELALVREERDNARRELEQQLFNRDQMSDRTFREQIERAIPALEERLADWEQRLLELTTDLDRRQRSVEKLQNKLDGGS